MDDLLQGGIRGCRLAHFELLEPIGVGGMAAVIRARDTQLDRQVALKILPPELAQDAESIRRFHQEARSAARLDHENIARVFYCGEDRHLHFIAFEYVEGENLRTILQRRRTLPVGNVLHYMIQITAGLIHASERQVVHRDIKPSNIIITPTGRAKLVDMGLARCLESQAESGLTHSGVTLGTFDYISPEQALEPHEADTCSDIYSLGCTFYHCLTGQPPVPEGTAAKKLHHHQYVPPLDPRQLVPDLPDEIAVILSRMMAKNRKHRYATPKELLRDLVAVAGRLEVAPEVIPPRLQEDLSGLLPADLPPSRSLVLGLVAIAAVVALIFFLGHSPQAESVGNRPEQQQANTIPRQALVQPAPDEGKTPPGSAHLPTGHPGGKPQPVVWTPPADASVHDLAAWADLHRGAERIEIQLDGDLDLSSRGDRPRQGILIQAEEVVIKRKKEARHRPTLRFTYDGEPQDRDRAALIIRSRTTTVEGIRLVVDARMAKTSIVGLLFEGGDKHTVQDCEFLQVRAPPDPGPASEQRLASVVLKAQTDHPSLLIEGCCFAGYRGWDNRVDSTPYLGRGADWPEDSPLPLVDADYGGQDAIVRVGEASILARNCAFAPHRSSFRSFLPPGADARSVLEIQRCSLMLGSESVAFDFPAARGGRVEVSMCLFSSPSFASDSAAEDAPRTVLIRQAAGAENLTFLGSNNVYHRIAVYHQEAGAGAGAQTWDAFQEWLRVHGGKDSSTPRLTSPWAETDLDLGSRLDEQRFLLAFLARTNAPDLRDPEDPQARLIGVERLLDAALYPEDLPSLPAMGPAPLVQRTLLVEPGGDPTNKLSYPRLEQALLGARPGDIIALRFNGELPVKPTQLNSREMGDITIQAYEGYRPVLTLGESTDLDTVLFELHDGSLRFEGIEFHLRCERAYDSLTLVNLVGDGICSFSRCVVTLDQADKETVLAVATLPDTKRVMKSDMQPLRSAEEGPQLVFKETLIRGDGDLLRSRASRSIALALTDTFVALGGSFLNITIPPEAVRSQDARVSVRLRQSTTYLAGHLVRIDARENLEGWVPVHFAPENCLFTPAPMGRSLLHLEGIEPDRDTLKNKLLIWKGAQNVYGPFASLLDHPSPGGTGMSLVMPKDQWRAFTEESTSHFAVKLASTPSRATRFPAFQPASVKLPDDLVGFGADPTVLPVPVTRPSEKISASPE
jgi:serine/threonine protein kinase